MEDASAAHCDQSSAEDIHRPGNGILLDLVNGCHLAHSAALAKAVASDHFQLEDHVKSEDLLNNNKEASEQDSLTNQRFVCSGDFTAVGDQIFAADIPKESFLTSPKDRNSAEYKERLNHLYDSCQTPDKGQEQDGREPYNVQSKGALSNYALKNNNDKDISRNHEMSQGELRNDEKRKETHNPCKVDLLKLREDPEDEEESYASESILGDGPKEMEINNLRETAVSDSDLCKRDLPGEVTKRNINSITEDCDELIHAGNNVNSHAVHLKTSKCDITSTKQKPNSSMEHYDVLANAVCESEDSAKNCSLDFQSKRFGLCLPKNDGPRRGKRKKEHRSLKCGRLQPVLHELAFVEEEDLSEKDESSEEENIDSAFHYSCSKDGLDHRKERHQYVSDKLDPDVLHLLEMHLRKQQLVDIKEEGEEEMLDVHINKEMSRSDSYKLLRNIPPVLDMVLEEPELEHSGDLLEEDSKTPSDIDSDDSGNVYSVEFGLMESLQYDLMSKSSKIDKHEIATILQEPSPEFVPKGNKRKQEDGALCLSERKSKPGNIQNKEPKAHDVRKDDPWCHSDFKSKPGNIQNKVPKAHEVQMEDPSDLQIIDEDGAEDVVESGIISEDVEETVEDIVNITLQPESNVTDSLKNKPEQHLALNEKEAVETPVIENTGIIEYLQDDQSSDLPSLDLVTDVGQLEVSEPVTEIDESKLHDRCAFNGSETALPDFTKAEIASGSPRSVFDGNGKFCLESRIPSEETDCLYSGDGRDFRKEKDSSEQHDDVDRVLTNQQINLTDVNKDVKVIKANVESPSESGHSEEPLCITANMNTLHRDLKPKILSLLEKAHAADCRSSHLQAEAELLFKESIELRNECKSLSKEAAELLSIFTQQEVLHRYGKYMHGSLVQIVRRSAECSLSTSDSKPRAKETLSFVSKRTSKKKKAENQLQILSKKYSFLRQEAPEIVRELHVLQQDLKNLSPHHSKPIGVLYKWLFGGLIAGGAMLLAWWSTKQLG
ncbi:uncharacterized protein ACMZJ9_012785 [Mantella aurantiaca]